MNLLDIFLGIHISSTLTIWYFLLCESNNSSQITHTKFEVNTQSKYLNTTFSPFKISMFTIHHIWIHNIINIYSYSYTIQLKSYFKFYILWTTSIHTYLHFTSYYSQHTIYINTYTQLINIYNFLLNYPYMYIIFKLIQLKEIYN